jgi:hypothetical protein
MANVCTLRPYGLGYELDSIQLSYKFYGRKFPPNR